MEDLLKTLVQSSWPTVWIMIIGYYFMSNYFMKQIEKKDEQNQENLNKFINLTEKAIQTMSDIWELKPILYEMHDDIKSLRK